MPTTTHKKETDCLVRLYPDETIIIPATSGERTFANSPEMFPGFNGSNFKGWNTDVPGEPTSPVEAAVYEMRKKDASFRVMLDSIGGNLGNLFWKVQDQPITFTEEHRNKLHPNGLATFFPFVVEGEDEIIPLVADVYNDGAILRARLESFDGGGIWNAVCRHRLVVPRLG